MLFAELPTICTLCEEVIEDVLEEVQPSPVAPVHYDIPLALELHKLLREGIREVALSDCGSKLTSSSTFWKREPLRWCLRP